MRELKILEKHELRDRIGLFVGTRPSIIKFAPLIRELEERGHDFFIIHTGQHYSYDMDQIFFNELELPKPKYKFLNIARCKFHGEQTAKMLSNSEKVLLDEKPRVVLVCADANFNFAGALAARKLHISVGHVEAGLRSNDWRMPEEHNRVMIDHISDLLFAPTEEARDNLIADNVKGKIFVTGNTIADAVKQNLTLAKAKSKVMDRLALKPKDYFLLTLHREENIDFRENLESILKGLKLVSEHFNRRIIFPVHPRTARRFKYFEIDSLLNGVSPIDPLGYLDFLILLKNARLVLTDSGGVQEEGCILEIPCVTLRESTERPETVQIGGNCVVGTNPALILRGTETMLNTKHDWMNPFGENASRKIIDVVEDETACSEL